MAISEEKEREDVLWEEEEEGQGIRGERERY